MDKTIMILGGGIMQVPSIKIGKKLGWSVICVDGNPQVPGADLADFFECVDIKDLDALEQLGRRYAAQGRLDGVFTAGTDFSTSVAWVTDKLDLPGISYETAVKATNKIKMRETFQAAGVSSPRFFEITGESDIKPALEQLGFPLVVKPVRSMGARGIRRIDTLRELEEFIPEAFSFSQTHSAIIEEYIPGKEFSIDAIVWEGEVIPCGIADRHIFFPPYFVEMGHTMPTDASDSEVREVLRVFEEGVNALGIYSGVAKGDIKLSPNGAVIGEIAARLSGGFMSGWTFPYSSGVSVTEAAMKIALGLPPGDLTPKKNNVSAERAFLSIPGRIKAIFSPPVDKLGPLVKDVFYLRKSGDRVCFPVNNVQKCGNVITEASSREEAVRAGEHAAGSVIISLETGNKDTDLFLNEDNPGFTGYPFYADTLGIADWLKEMKKLLPVSKVAAPGEKNWYFLVPEKFENLESGDWYGRTLSEVVDLVSLARGISFTKVFIQNADTLIKGGLESVLLGGDFWNHLLKGSVQGALYFVDTLRGI